MNPASSSDRRDLRGHRVGELDGDEEALPAHPGEAGVAETGDLLAQPGAQLGHVGEQALVLDDADDGERRRGGHRVAAEGGAVLAGAEQRRGVLAQGHRGADREAAAQALGEGDDVGHDAAADVRQVVRHPGAGAAHAGLDLVEDEQRPGGRR